MDEKSQIRDQLIEQVRNAFAGVTLGSGIGLYEAQAIDDYLSDSERAKYRDKDETEDWSRITPRQMDECYSSPSFFDAEGRLFHLPAFIVADLQDVIRIPDFIFHSTAPGFVSGYFNLLNVSQREAIRDYLEFRFIDPNYEFAHDLIFDSLEQFWGFSDKWK